MKKILFSLLALSVALVSCGPSKTYVAVEEATAIAMTALDTVSAPSSVVEIASNWSAVCGDAIASNGELKGEEVSKFMDMQIALQGKVTLKSDSLSRLLIQQMTIIEPPQPIAAQ